VSICECENPLIMSVATAIILDTRRIKANKKFPVKLRVNFSRETIYYSTIFDLEESQYQKLSAPRISADLRIIKDKLKELERDVERAVKETIPFRFIDFEKRFIQHHPLFKHRKQRSAVVLASSPDVFDYSSFVKKFPILLEVGLEEGSIAYAYQTFIKKLLVEGRISNAVIYHCSYVSLKKFRGNVRFTEITPTYLVAFEQKLRGEGLSKTTIGFYLRPLRAIYNEGIEEGLAQKDRSYPFGKRKYQIPTSRNIKKALTIDDVKRIYYYDDEQLTETEQRYKSYWLFSYFANGMNPKDIACLRYENIQDEFIIFERAKTESSLRNDPKTITVFINEDMREIIRKWGNPHRSPKDYIFPILQNNITPLRQYTLIQNLVSVINDCMKRILMDLKIDKKATTYVARHTFSTVLKRSGASTEYIQEALGHTNKKTTENYLDSFEKEEKKQYANKLLAFKNDVTSSEESIS
jgi:integrase/recombinase XerD